MNLWGLMMAINKQRTVVASLTLSAAALVSLVLSESYTDKAVIPTKGDRPTVGFGSTFREDGTPVQITDTITPPKALARTLAHVGKDEARVKQCVTAPLNQVEYDTMLDFSYQYGTTALCNSSIVSYANAGDYVASCEAYLLYKKSAGYDCSTLVNGKPNKRCWGVWARSVERRDKCMAAQ